MEEIARNAAEEAAKIAAGEATKTAAEEAAKTAAEATSSASAPGTASAGMDVEMGAAGDAVLAADNHPIAPDAPPVSESLRLSSPQRGTDIPSTADTGERALGSMDEELIIPPSTTTEEERDADDDAEDYYFLQSMSDSFKGLQKHYSRHLEKLQRRATNIEKAEQEFLQLVDEAQVWYAEKVQDIKVRQIQLAADREAFILEKAEADIAQAEAAEKAAATNRELIQRKVSLDSHEDDLVVREENLAATLHAKDEEIQALLTKRTEEFEQKHREALQSQATEHAGKLKEALDAAEAADSAKVILESQVKKLEDALAAKDKEVAALKDSA